MKSPLGEDRVSEFSSSFHIRTNRAPLSSRSDRVSNRGVDAPGRALSPHVLAEFDPNLPFARLSGDRCQTSLDPTAFIQKVNSGRGIRTQTHLHAGLRGDLCRAAASAALPLLHCPTLRLVV